MGDVKGKEMEQDRKGTVKNQDIDLNRTHQNYDLVESDLTLYQRVKERVNYAKETGSRVQKNSVVMYSNILTVPEEMAKIWGEEKTKAYFESCYAFFSKEFGKENVVSAKVHLDETSPHMHLHFVPFNKETGKLQARVAMNKAKINYIHDELPKFLRERGFDVERGKGRSKEQNIKDIHEYKEVQREIAGLQQEKERLRNELAEASRQLKETKEELEKKSKGLESLSKTFESRLKLSDDLKYIKSRTSPHKSVKRLLGGKEEEEQVKLPKKDYMRLLTLAKRGVGAEQYVSLKMDELKEKEKGFVKYKDAYQEVVPKYNELAQKYNGLREHSDWLLEKNKGLETKLKEMIVQKKKDDKTIDRLIDFMVSEDKVEQFKEWNQKMERHERQQRNRNRGMER